MTHWPNLFFLVLTPEITSAALGDEQKVRERVQSFELVQESASGVKYSRCGKEIGGGNYFTGLVLVDGQ
jgi:hypothetical protein